jgi:hypothetical protein
MIVDISAVVWVKRVIDIKGAFSFGTQLGRGGFFAASVGT